MTFSSTLLTVSNPPGKEETNKAILDLLVKINSLASDLEAAKKRITALEALL
jgi:hypothetical protein